MCSCGDGALCRVSRSLPLRPDVPDPTPPTVDQVTSCAAVTEDDYFVAPPGNVPLETSNTYRDERAGPAAASAPST